MNDTKKEMFLLQYFQRNKNLSSSEVLELTKSKVSQVTIKRYLSALTQQGYLNQLGAGRSIKYVITKKGLLLRSFNVSEYLALNPDKRLGSANYWFDIFKEPFVALFSDNELQILNEATAEFRSKSKRSDDSSRNKELLRFIVEFSWKTSQIEGNTYDLLSTERLLLYGQKSPTNSQHESQMILNQKEALEFILNNINTWKKPNTKLLEALHNRVGDKLGITKGLRKTLVGITGTSYKPLENEYQIKEALKDLFDYLKTATSVYEKALLAVLGVSYIQPFVDGNKRTSRLLANAILMTENAAPISYRSVDDTLYKEASLIFYEQNSIEPFKKLFIEQYVFSASNYNISR